MKKNHLKKILSSLIVKSDVQAKNYSKYSLQIAILESISVWLP